jgi:hypothetical protein
MIFRNKNIKLIFTKLLLIVVISISNSCRKPVSYGPVPEITYGRGEFEYKIDALGNRILNYNVKIEFADGDGDIGWGDSNENPGLMRPCSTEFTHDLYIEMFEKIDGVFEKRIFNTDYYCENDTLKNRGVNNLNANLPYMTGRGQAEVLIGDIYYDIALKGLKSDTIKFSFVLSDRQNNLSNKVESPELVTPSR